MFVPPILDVYKWYHFFPCFLAIPLVVFFLMFFYCLCFFSDLGGGPLLLSLTFFSLFLYGNGLLSVKDVSLFIACLNFIVNI